MYEIRYDPAVHRDLAGISRHHATRVLDEVDKQLTREPSASSRRKKMLAGLDPPWDQVRPVWQLRVGDFRVFYDVDEKRRQVIIRAVRRKGRQATEGIL